MTKKKDKLKFLPKLYNFNYDDKTTWAYSGCLISGSEKDPVVTWIKNPKFKYSHLLENY